MLGSSGLQVLLGVIPGSSGVGGRDGKLDARDEGTNEDTSKGTDSEEGSDDKRGEDDQGTWRSHLGKRGLRGDLNALLVLWLRGTLHQARDSVELSSDLLNHGEGSPSDTLHGHGTEPVWKHSSDQESREDLLVKNGSTGKVNISTGHVRSEEGQGHEGGRANGETLSDGGGGVSGGVKSISSLTDLLSHLGHLGDTSGVIGDRSVGINGKASGQGSEHTKGRASDSVHSRAGVGEVDGHSQSTAWDDARLVTKGKSEDDVGGSTGLARVGDVNDWLVGVTGVDLGHVSDQVTGDESKGNRDEHLPVVHGLDRVVRHVELELAWEGSEGNSENHNKHEHGTDLELPLEGRLDLRNVLGRGNVGGHQGGEEAHDDSASGEHERVVHGGPVVASGQAVAIDAPSGSEGGQGRDDEGSASGLGEGAEEIGSHSSDVTNVVANVVSNDGRVPWVILRDVLLDLSDQVGTDVGGLGVDTSSDSSEEGDGGPSQAVPGDALVETSPVVLEVEHLEEDDGGEEDEKTQPTEQESHDGSGPEGGHEGWGDSLPGLEGGPSVGVGRDHHSQVSGQGGRGRSQDEGDGGEQRDEESRGLWPSVDVGRVLGLEPVLRAEEDEDHGRERGHEVEDVLVLRGEEPDGSVGNRVLNVGNLGGDGGIRSGPGLEQGLAGALLVIPDLHETDPVPQERSEGHGEERRAGHEHAHERRTEWAITVHP
mmetsp:Transcript_5154/g.15486  ORF Transcript_5154/g.15486 Transcript_5154/m.15486 type:complete len:710 (+) Transcript_5154:1915-4044(+)